MKTTLIGSYTLIKKEVFRFCRIWLQTLLPPVVTANLYFYVIGHLLGSYVGEINNVPYAFYIVPGLVMMAIITSSYNNASFSFFNACYQKSIEEVLTAPMPISVIVLGYVIGSTIRGAMVGSFVLMSFWLIAKIPVANFGFTLCIMILCALFFSLLGLTNALLAKTYDGITFVPNFVLAPLIYLGGAFYPIELVPGDLKYILGCNPMIYLVDLFKAGILKMNNNVMLQIELSFLFFAILLLFMINSHLLSKGDR